MASEREVVVALTDAERFPGHASATFPPSINQSAGGWSNWRGKPIRIFAEPHGTRSFKCDTGCIWQVVPEQVLEIWPDHPRPWSVFVCRHEVQIGAESRAEKLAREIIEGRNPVAEEGKNRKWLEGLISTALDEVKREERERCARVCDDYGDTELAAAIRAGVEPESGRE